MTQAKVKRVCVLALGLIGGSLAKALRENGFAAELVGWGRRETSLKRGVELGVIDRYSLDLREAVAGADIIVVATPTLIAEGMLKALAELSMQGHLQPQAVITDVASVKGNLLRAARDAFGEVPANLVLGHPIAGSEKSGVEAANAQLFIDHRVILTPVRETDPKAVERVSAMWASVGAELATMSVEEHDEVLAATSHLPHVLAYVLVDALAAMEERQDIFRYAAGGFRDFTRIASSDPTMWHEISLANRSALLKMIDAFSDQLSRLRTAIEQEDSETIKGCYSRAKTARDNFASQAPKPSASQDA